VFSVQDVQCSVFRMFSVQDVQCLVFSVQDV